MKSEGINELVGSISSNTVILIVLILAGSFLLSRFIRQVLNKFAEKYTARRILFKNFIPLANILLNIGVVSYIFFFVLRITAETMLALGVSAGVAIGFAVQDILANAFGGLIVIFTRPFNIGDKIEIGSYYGEVSDISLLKVRIVTPDDSVVSIPTKTFLQSSTSNANSGALDCQVVCEITLPGYIDSGRVRELALEAAYCSPYTYLKKPVVVNMRDDFSFTSCTIVKVKAYVCDHRYENRYASDLMERIKSALVDCKLLNSEAKVQPPGRSVAGL